MDATPANRLSVGFRVEDRRWSRLSSPDHRGTRRVVMVEFYTTVHITGPPPAALPRMMPPTIRDLATARHRCWSFMLESHGEEAEEPPLPGHLDRAP